MAGDELAADQVTDQPLALLLAHPAAGALVDQRDGVLVGLPRQ